jgi:hypothetical protein
MLPCLNNLETAVMKRNGIIGVICILLLGTNLLFAEDCRIINGSFELDEGINDIAAKEPNGWDVNIPAGRFFGYVYTNWPTDGQYNLTLYADWFVTFAAGDTARVYQQLNLTDVNEIVFDLKLQTDGFTPWDPKVCTPVLMIDNDVVWQADTSKKDIRAEYRNVTYAVGDKYRDSKEHKLSLGIKVNTSGMLYDRYITRWDKFRCTTFCDGLGLLAGDFNYDCFVDANDLQLMADVWLDQVQSYSRYNLFNPSELSPDSTVDLRDFAAFADNWLSSSYQQGQ